MSAYRVDVAGRRGVATGLIATGLFATGLFALLGGCTVDSTSSQAGREGALRAEAAAPPLDPSVPPIVPAADPTHERLKIEHWTRDDGLEVILVARPGTGLVSVDLAFRSGSADDPPDRIGLANLAGKLVLYGTDALERRAFDERLADIGGRIRVKVGETRSTVYGSVLARNTSAYLDLLAATVRRDALPDDDFEKAQREVVAAIGFDRDNDRLSATKVFGEFVFDGHPFGRWPEGTQSSVGRIRLRDVERWRRKHWVLGNGILAVSGDITRASLETELGRLLPPDGREAPVRARQAPEAHEERRVMLVDRPRRSQNVIRIGHTTIPPRDPKWPILRIASAILGANFSSRLNRDLRAKRGWTYSIETELWKGPSTAAFLVSTFTSPDRAIEMIGAVLEHLERLVRDGATEEEVRAAATYVAGEFALDNDTPRRLAVEALSFLHLGLAPEDVAAWPDRVKAVTTEAFNAGVAELIFPARVSIVMLCSAQLFEQVATTLDGVRQVEVVSYLRATE